MKVRELIEILKEQDPEANVFVMMQPNWPFECALRGVTTRADMEGADEDEDEDEATGEKARRETAASDVFLVEGEQLRYGNRAAWDVARRD